MEIAKFKLVEIDQFRKKVAGCMSGFWRLDTQSKWHVTC